MISIQTNVAALYGQQNLSVNSQLQQTTINRLTSGYRINSSADDAAGLAIANALRSQRTELTQGIRNANDGVSQRHIIDGGLNNISQYPRPRENAGGSGIFGNLYGRLRHTSQRN